MNWLTVVLALLIGWLTYRAYRNGFVQEFVSLSAVVLAIPLAGIFYDNMFPKVQPIVDDENLASLVSFLAIMGGVIIGGQVAAHLLKGVVHALNLGFIDTVGGTAFGLLKGIIISQALLVALVTFPKPDVTESIDESPLATQLLQTAPAVLTVLPSHFDDTLATFLAGATTVDKKLGAPAASPTARR